MSEPVSTLNGAAAEAGQTIRIEDRGPVGQVTLRGDLSSKALAKAVKAGVGVAVPGTRQAAFKDGRGAVWMAPDELLLFTEYSEAGTLTAALESALADEHHMAVDVSDARAVLTLSGAGVAEVLAKGAPVDLSEGAFPVGSARRTHVGGIAVGFWRKTETEWEIVCFRSLAKHLFDWLVAASRAGSEVGYY
ncbi:MAG TPA: sarcosine oxidase subunit gamma family protein [Thermohalobaculum sp.]|nr:sarcosine oxidase subunit gamma family protein [Thermohalobaculum sp.]